MVRSPARNAELALLLEVAGTPKPGNVDRERDVDDLHFEHFLAGAVGTQKGLRLAAGGTPVGEAFEAAVAGMSDQSGGNTQFGCLLLLVPLVRATTQRGLAPESAAHVVEHTTVADAADFYCAFEHVDVYVDDPPEDMGTLDVRRGSDAVPELERRGLTLYDVMERSAPADGVAAEWVNGFERTFETADRIESGQGPVTDRAADAFLALLAEEPDTLVAKRHGRETAREVRERAAELHEESERADRDDVREFADELVERGVNPGTTADLVAAGLYVALERGVEL
ncbi:triphosphoribosyl-dephospho-CoA synthase [Halospeciosus flavus]|uniref:Triphosphoribosyl-dephospho-CoA synthase n=1 Tax=Halospeciosus flavus TaxID=3032283 RepID=A0ABD5Z940_9EURY|nr:triphosphoribosyl-dephospho-CoA synthase [Halospeciosus flavus]